MAPLLLALHILICLKPHSPSLFSYPGSWKIDLLSKNTDKSLLPTPELNPESLLKILNLIHHDAQCLVDTCLFYYCSPKIRVNLNFPFTLFYSIFVHGRNLLFKFPFPFCILKVSPPPPFIPTILGTFSIF